jgi:hypothetical protein
LGTLHWHQSLATAALLDAIVVTGDASEFEVLAWHFSGVAVLSA